MNNPYPRYKGFSARVAYAECRLTKLSQDPHCLIFTRAFDNCFENGDGDAVVFALMQKSAQNPLLLKGIEQLQDGKVPPSWLELFNGESGQMGLFE